MRNHAGRIANDGGNVVFKYRSANRGAHARTAAHSKAAGHIVKPGDQVCADQHTVTRFDGSGHANAGAHFGIADDNRDCASNTGGTASRRASNGNDNGFVVRRSGNNNVFARFKGLGNQLCIFADERKHFVLKHVYIYRSAHRRAAGTAGRGCENDHLLNLAIGVNGHAA